MSITVYPDKLTPVSSLGGKLLSASALLNGEVNLLIRRFTPLSGLILLA